MTDTPTPAQQLEKVLARVDAGLSGCGLDAADFLILNAPLLRRALAALEAVEAVKPHRSHTKPSSPGVYGVRGYEFGIPLADQFEAVVLVRRGDDGELRCNMHSETTDREIENWSYVEDMSNKFEWCRFDFAAPPTDAVEVK